MVAVVKADKKNQNERYFYLGSYYRYQFHLHWVYDHTFLPVVYFYNRLLGQVANYFIQTSKIISKPTEGC